MAAAATRGGPRRCASCCCRRRAWRGPASKLPPTVAAVIDYQRILRDARAARADSRPGGEPAAHLSGGDREGGAATSRGRQGPRDASGAVLSPEDFAERRATFEGDVAAVQRMAQERRRQLDQVAAAAFNEVRAAMIEVRGRAGGGARVQLGASQQRPSAVFAADRYYRRGTVAAGRQAAEHQGAREGRLTAALIPLGGSHTKGTREEGGNERAGPAAGSRAGRRRHSCRSCG